MPDSSTDVVTGAFSFTGSYIADRLLDAGRDVVTLTNHPNRRTAFSERVRTEPYAFDDFDALIEILTGVDTLYNTYWIRIPRDGTTFADAIDNSRTLIEAADAAGVRRLVHFSVSNPSRSAPPYYRGKAKVEEIVTASDLSTAILRPTLIFGVEDILLNNIAWFMRRLPVFGVFGNGDYRVQPVYAGDVADIAIEHGQRNENVTIDVAGPDVYTFEELLQEFAHLLDVRCRILRLPLRFAYAGVKLLELFVDDTILTWDEATVLMDGYLTTDTPPRGTTKFTDWVRENAESLGRDYASFRERHGR
ncbi:NADH dehydrogenase [Haladaptatus litoreus]|uniref:NADH dehydrogenase n=1 Tax=Haladaptatus litoreus TaxID=553468 RepID=A0A1N6XUF8_9EURY|nr:NAD-dependent epimerase/dehydratase family protein [Haladaptatus litoreus]SIR06075.1 NADH dehydrogenase [Haladaptatus litoreus]